MKKKSLYRFYNYSDLKLNSKNVKQHKLELLNIIKPGKTFGPLHLYVEEKAFNEWFTGVQ